MNSETSDALRLEEVEDQKTINAALEDTEREVKAVQHETTVRGLLHSGGRHVKEMEIRFDKIVVGTIKAAISKRRELGAKFPELLTEPLLNQLKERLKTRAESFVEGQKTRATIGGTDRSGIAGVLVTLAKQKADGFKVLIGQEVEALRLEGRLGMHKQETKVTFNISNSTIASLNLGTVVGDLTASVQALNNQGQQELARTIQLLAEALAGSTELPADRRKELMEHLSLVSEEVARPPEKRKMGLVKSSIAVLQAGLATASTIADLWKPVEHVLKTLGMLS